MANCKVCDRCGRVINRYKSEKQRYIFIDRNHIFNAGRVNQLELCDECLASFIKWAREPMNGEEKP